MINKKLIAANFIFRHIRKGEVVNITSVHGVDAEVLEFEVKEGAKILHDELRNLDFPRTAVIGGVIRKNKRVRHSDAGVLCVFSHKIVIPTKCFFDYSVC